MLLFVLLDEMSITAERGLKPADRFTLFKQREKMVKERDFTACSTTARVTTLRISTGLARINVARSSLANCITIGRSNGKVLRTLNWWIIRDRAILPC